MKKDLNTKLGSGVLIGTAEDGLDGVGGGDDNTVGDEEDVFAGDYADETAAVRLLFLVAGFFS